MYHYCSVETLVQIVLNKTVRFSDANMMNDAEEGVWGYQIFLEASRKLLARDGIPDEIPVISKEFFDRVDEIWSPMQFGLLSFISCFSTDGDSLSQWRAYADDGRGVAIGFKAQHLRKMPIQILDVLYDHDEQVKEMVIALGAMYLELLDNDHDYDQHWFLERCLGVAATSYAFKNPAWRDEKEVRCQHLVDVVNDGEVWKLQDNGGSSEGQEVAGQPISFGVRKGVIVPYFDMPFSVSLDENPIAEIVLGPRCMSGVGNIMFLLGNNGFPTIPLKLAGGAYR